MSKQLYLVVFFIGLPACLFAQLIRHPNLQALRQAFAGCNSDNCRIPILVNIANFYITRPGELTTDLDSGLLFADKAQELNRAVGNTEYQGLYYLVCSKDYHERNDIAKAEGFGRQAVANFLKQDHFEEAGDALREMSYFYSSEADSTRNLSIGLCSRAADYFGRARSIEKRSETYERIAELYIIDGQNQRAIDTLHRALALNGIQHLVNLPGIYRSLGAAAENLGKPEDAINYLFQALREIEKSPDSVSGTSVAIYNQIGILYYSRDDWQDAETYFRKAFELGEAMQVADIGAVIDNAVNSIFKGKGATAALRFLSAINKEFSRPGADYTNLMIAQSRCNLFLYIGKPEWAEQDAKKLLLVINRLPVEESYFLVHRTVVKYYLSKGNARAAQLYLDRMKTMNISIAERKEVYWYQFQIDSTAGQYKDALAGYRKYIQLNDSTSNQNVQKQLIRAKLEYQTERKDRELIVKQKNIELLSSQTKINMLELNLLISGALALIILLIVVYSRYRLRTRTNRQLELQQQEINAKNTKLQKVIEEKDALIVEKEWLVKEIHHRVKNNLQIMISLLRMQTSYLDDTEAIRAVADSRHRLQAISLLHQKLYHEGQLEVIDMETYINNLINYLKGSFSGLKNLKFERIVEPLKLQVSLAIPIGLIINEAVTNAVKYAFPGGRPGVVTISLVKEMQLISLWVKDDGIGLDGKQLREESRSMGVRLIEILADQIGGTLQISSKDGVTIAVTQILYDPSSQPG